MKKILKFYQQIIILFSILLLNYFSLVAQTIDYTKIRELTPKDRLQKLKLLIEQNPQDKWAHYWYISYLNDTVKLERQYNIWMIRYPNVAEIPYALGNLFIEENSPTALKYLNLAIKINPKMADVWLDLSLFAYRNNDLNARNTYLENAVNANPDNAELNYRYAISFSDLDSNKYKKLLIKTAEIFPESEYAIKALNALAFHEKNPEEKIKYYESVKTIFISQKQKHRAASDVMNSYYTFLLGYDVEKTIPLLQDLLRPKFRSDDWGLLLFVSSRVMMAKNLIKEKKGEQALSILNHIELPYFVREPKNLIPILKAQAMASIYNDAVAYDSLIVYFSKKPSFEIYQNIVAYGLKQSKDSVQIKNDILKVLQKNVANATPFKLMNYQTNDSLSLDSLQGNVILLTYWYPQCGPCRAELPYFENVLKKFNTEKIKYIAINIVEKEKNQVLPLIEKQNYTFIPLEERKYRNKGNLDNMGAAPENFLIDQNGRLIFKDFRIDEDNEKDLELMIKLLLD